MIQRFPETASGSLTSVSRSTTSSNLKSKEPISIKWKWAQIEARPHPESPWAPPVTVSVPAATSLPTIPYINPFTIAAPRSSTHGRDRRSYRRRSPPVGVNPLIPCFCFSMERYRPHRSPQPDRFLSIFSRSDPVAPAINGGLGVELLEDEVLWTVSDSPEMIRSPRTPSPSMPSALDPRASPFSRIPGRNSGILVALAEEENKQLSAAVGPFLQRKASISASSASTSPSSTSSVRMIPTIPKLKPDYNDGNMLHQSVPVNIPMIPSMAKHRPEANGRGADAGDVVDGDDDEMLPPHEIIARRSGVESPMTTFSVLEGVGRTLKGSDLRRVRNAVWRKTGFVD